MAVRYTYAVREVYIKTPKGLRWPLSKGLLTESLMNAGIKMEAALSMAHMVEERLRSRKRPEISPSALKRMLITEVEKALGEEVAQKLRNQTPAFEEILVLEGYRRRPFSKGVLARSLGDAGFDVKESHALAKAVETELRQEGITEIGAAELEERVAKAIRQHYGEPALKRYEGRRSLAGELFVEEREGEPRVPFSKGVLAQSVMAVGLSPDASYRLARETERRLYEGGSGIVSRDKVRSLVAELLREEAGEEVARRYELLRAVRRTVRPVHILIGGVTGVGKSLLASALSYRLGITHLISTDSVREILRSTVPPDLLPTLHTSSFDAWSMLATPEGSSEDPTLVLQGFRDQVSRVAVGLRAIQDRNAQEHTSLVLEGVHVVPGYLSHPWQNEVIQIPMMLVVEDEKLHKDRFTLRERETSGVRSREMYVRNFDKIRLIQSHLLSLAEASGIPVIQGENLDNAVERALEVVLERMQKVYRAQVVRSE